MGRRQSGFTVFEPLPAVGDVPQHGLQLLFLRPRFDNEGEPWYT
jgi:hypothetical protein